MYGLHAVHVTLGKLHGQLKEQNTLTTRVDTVYALSDFLQLYPRKIPLLLGKSISQLSCMHRQI